MEQAAIGLIGEQGSDLMDAVVEYKPVKNGIDDIPHGPRKDQGYRSY